MSEMAIDYKKHLAYSKTTEKGIRKLKRAWPNLEDHPFPGFGYREIMAHPELMAREISKFLNDTQYGGHNL